MLKARIKHAAIAPLLKHSGLPIDDYASYRPISNLPYASKLLKRLVSAQLRLHLQHNGIGDPFQSAYRPPHSVETAIVRIQDDTQLYCVHWMLVNMEFWYCLSSALHSIRSTTTFFHRAVFWALSSFLSTVQVFQKFSQSTEFATASTGMIC